MFWTNKGRAVFAMKVNETRLFYFLVLTDVSDIARDVKEQYG